MLQSPAAPLYAPVPSRGSALTRLAGPCLGALCLAGCGQSSRQAPPTSGPVTTVAPAPSPPATPAPPPGPIYTLVLTWLTADQPPATTQTIFHDAASCGRARDAALAEGQRLDTNAVASFAAARARYASGAHRFVGRTPLDGEEPPVPPVVPKVSAFCAGG